MKAPFIQSQSGHTAEWCAKAFLDPFASAVRKNYDVRSHPIPAMISPTMHTPPGNPDSDSQPPSTVDELTAQNVKSIAALDREAKKQDTPGSRLAGTITRFCGSMLFVWVHVAWFGIWIAANTLLPGVSIDPYPFSFLTLVVSLEAIFLSTFIMIAENRQERINERRSHLDLQINLLSEQENTKILELLEKIALKVGADTGGDPTVAVLEQATRPSKLLEQIDESIREVEEEPPPTA